MTSAAAARTAVQNATGGSVVCLAAGTYGDVDLRGLPDRPSNPVTFKGADNRASTVNSILYGNTSGLVVEGFRATRGIHAGNQSTTTNITIRLNDIGGTAIARSGGSAIHAVGMWGSNQMHTFVVERNYIHDAYRGIEAQGDTPNWTVRLNKFERIGDGDYLQSGNPANWVVDHNWFLGPGIRLSEPEHPDLWQILDGNSAGTSITFSNNRVHQTDFGPSSVLNGVTTGLMFGEVLHNLRIVNNLLNRISDGNTCMIYTTVGLVFEDNTIRTGRNGWSCIFNQGAPGSANYSVKRNVATNAESTIDLDASPPHLSCGGADSCAAFNAGRANNVSDEPILYGPGSIQNWLPSWSGDGWYRTQGVSAGHSLTPAEFQGYPFE